MSIQDAAQYPVHYEETERFLATLIGEGWEQKELLFQTFKEGKEVDGKSILEHKIFSTWNKAKARLETLNRAGAVIALTINETKDGGRKKEDFKTARAVWCDWDNPEKAPPKWPIEPHIIVQTSDGKFHFYWLCEPTLARDDHQEINRCLSAYWGGDPNAVDVTRVLRLPGFYHLKGEPYLVTVAKADQILPRYPTQKLQDGFKLWQWKQTWGERPGKNAKRRPVYDFNRVQAASALRSINADDREVWFKVGAALESTGSKYAYSIWNDWSRKSDKYDEDEQRKTWQGFRTYQPPPDSSAIGIGTLYALAKEAGWRAEEWRNRLNSNAQGKPFANPANIATIVENTPKWSAHLFYNSYANVIEYYEEDESVELDDYKRPLGIPQWSDEHLGRLAEDLNDEYAMNCTSLRPIAEGVEIVARSGSYDPIINWLDSLPEWDGIDRLEAFFSDFCGAKVSEYTAWLGKSLFLSLVARGYKPGEKVDTVIVLRGKQGIKKTSLCKLLGGPWYKSITLSLETKEIYSAIRTCWLGELAELDSLYKSEYSRVASFLTTTVDHFRPPYGRYSITQKRRTVFIGTTNERAFINDNYGARRFYPIDVDDINLEGVGAVLLQLFSEAKARLERGENWWQEPESIKEQVAAERELARKADPLEDRLVPLLLGKNQTTIMEILEGLNIPTAQWSHGLSTRIGMCLYRLGWEKKRKPRASEDERIEFIYVRQETGEL